MNAAFMSLQPRESGTHAVCLGAGEASVTEVRFRCAPQAGGEARADHDQLKLTVDTLLMVLSWPMCISRPRNAPPGTRRARRFL
jgi:hypothetical protein